MCIFHNKLTLGQ